MSALEKITKEAKNGNINLDLVVSALIGFRKQNGDTLTNTEDMELGQSITSFIRVREIGRTDKFANQ